MKFYKSLFNFTMMFLLSFSHKPKLKYQVQFNSEPCFTKQQRSNAAYL